jgi:predicted nuclease of restriction endonuclease-like RecB superfamily
MTKQINFSNSGEIDPSKVKQAVFSKIDFPLAEDWWDQIEAAFKHSWNVDIGIRGVIYEDQIEKYVYEQLRKNDLLITSEQVNQIIGIMLHYIETSGGYLEETENAASKKEKPTPQKSDLPCYLITYGSGETELFYGDFRAAWVFARSKSGRFSVESYS